MYICKINSFTYVLASTCYPKENINNVPEGIALRLRRICDTDEKFNISSSEYQNYLIVRDYKPTLVKTQFHAIKNSRREARQVKPKVIKSNFTLITVYNPVMKNLGKILNDNLHILYGDPDIKKLFPEGTISVTCKRGKCLSLLHCILELSQSLHLGLVSVMRVDVTYVRIIWFLKMNSLVMLQVRYIR